ncbi:MAG: TRAM domain-containing protein, partial [Magnetococcales bacterium]|nr:TRAM domain-containing protein [Magnetococcales bacterium]
LARRLLEIGRGWRLRISSIDPLDIDDGLIALLADAEQVCPHLHLSIQSGDDDVRRRMGRGRGGQAVLGRIARLRAVRADLVLGADFIVGFPGESEEDFCQTLELAQRVSFDHAYSFIFSARPGTVAAGMEDLVPLAVAQERLARLQAVLGASQRAGNLARVGCEESVLVEGHSKRDDGVLTGRTLHNRTVNFPGEATSIGQIVRVRVTEGLANSLRGELL